MTERSRRNAPFRGASAAVLHRQDIDQIGEFEVVLDAADINVNPPAVDV